MTRMASSSERPASRCSTTQTSCGTSMPATFRPVSGPRAPRPHRELSGQVHRALGTRNSGWCPRSGSNRHTLRYRILSPARLPIPPLGLSGVIARPILDANGIGSDLCAVTIAGMSKCNGAPSAFLVLGLRHQVVERVADHLIEAAPPNSRTPRPRRRHRSIEGTKVGLPDLDRKLRQLLHSTHLLTPLSMEVGPASRTGAHQIEAQRRRLTGARAAESEPACSSGVDNIRRPRWRTASTGFATAGCAFRPGSR